jgi:hypothetical protein
METESASKVMEEAEDVKAQGGKLRAFFPGTCHSGESRNPQTKRSETIAEAVDPGSKSGVTRKSL